MLTKTDKQCIKFMEEKEHSFLTIYQCYKMFYRDWKYGHDYARKRLKKLCDDGVIKKTTNPVNDEYVYYLDKKPSPHNIYLIDFYSTLIFHGATIIEFKKEPRYFLNDSYIEPDGFFKFNFNGITQGCFVEVDFTHQTDLSKYEPYMKGIFEELYGGNPFVVIISENHKKYKVPFDVVYLDFKLTNFVFGQ